MCGGVPEGDMRPCWWISNKTRFMGRCIQRRSDLSSSNSHRLVQVRREKQSMKLRIKQGGNLFERTPPPWLGFFIDQARWTTEEVYEWRQLPSTSSIRLLITDTCSPYHLKKSHASVDLWYVSWPEALPARHLSRLATSSGAFDPLRCSAMVRTWKCVLKTKDD